MTRLNKLKLLLGPNPTFLHLHFSQASPIIIRGANNKRKMWTLLYTHTHAHRLSPTHTKVPTLSRVCIHTHAHTQTTTHTYRTNVTTCMKKMSLLYPKDNFIFHFGQQLSENWYTRVTCICSLAKLFNYFIRFTLFAFSPHSHTHARTLAYAHKRQLALSTHV